MKENYNWYDLDNQRAFLKQLSQKLKHESMEDWYKITPNEITSNGGDVLLQQYKSSVRKMLESVFPDYQWNLSKFDRFPKVINSLIYSRDKKFKQNLLLKILNLKN